MNILIAGEGGQGVQVIAEILAKSAFFEGKYSLYIPNFGVEQRGGASLAFVTIDNKPVYYPKFDKADILAVLSDRSKDRVKDYIGPKTQVVLGPAVSGGLKTDLPVKTWNIFVLGQVNKAGKIVSLNTLTKAIDERFHRQFKVDPSLREQDLKALKNKQA